MRAAKKHVYDDIRMHDVMLIRAVHTRCDCVHAPDISSLDLTFILHQNK